MTEQERREAFLADYRALVEAHGFIHVAVLQPLDLGALGVVAVPTLDVRKLLSPDMKKTESGDGADG